MARKIKIDVIKGCEGKSLYINDYRVCGSKPWGGGKVIEHFEVDYNEVAFAINPKKEGKNA